MSRPPAGRGAGPGDLRLVGETGAALPDDDRPGLARPPRQSADVVSLPGRVPTEVRRRRTLLVVMGVMLGVLALPLSGTGGHSHPIGSAQPDAGPITYVVQPGDSLWSIAQRVDPSGDPRPLMTRLASQIGSDTVVPGERVVLP